LKSPLGTDIFHGCAECRGLYLARAGWLYSEVSKTDYALRRRVVHDDFHELPRYFFSGRERAECMLIATFQLDHEAVALRKSFEQVPELQIEAERIAAHSTEWTMPCLWVSGAESISVRKAFEGDPSIETIVGETEFGDEIYYHIEWNDDVQERINSYIDKQGAIIRASVTPEGWRLRIRFVNRDQFDTFRSNLSEQGFSYSLLELTEPNEPRAAVTDLTPRQHEVLVAAWEQGYYEIPRNISSDELANDLGISHQTLSELLRRGTNKLIKSQLVTPAQRRLNHDA